MDLCVRVCTFKNSKRHLPPKTRFPRTKEVVLTHKKRDIALPTIEASVQLSVAKLVNFAIVVRRR